MINNLIQKLSGVSHELVIIILSFLPISELRGAIPVAITFFNFSIVKSFILSLIGNFSFVVPFLFFLNYLTLHLMKIKLFNKFFTWWFKKVESKSKKIKELEFLGLILFVAIPLPMTGAWSGCIASYLLKMKIHDSAIAIFIGIFIAGIIVTLATVLGLKIINLF